MEHCIKIVYKRNNLSTKFEIAISIKNIINMPIHVRLYS